jgi:hypothetical protein
MSNLRDGDPKWCCPRGEVADAIDAVEARVQKLEAALAVEADPRFRDRVRTLEERQDAVETRLAKMAAPAPVAPRALAPAPISVSRVGRHLL